MATITVLGLGYIGLPTAAMFTTHGHTVHGYDVDDRIIHRLRKGEVLVEEPGLLAFVQSALQSGRFVPSDRVEKADVYVICVPTPFHLDSKRSDLSHVRAASKSLVPLLKRGDLVVVESTVPAGTTQELVVPVLETSGLSCRTDVLVASCPETVLPGNMIYELAHNHRVVGGHTPEAAVAASDLYRTFVQADIVTTDSTTAEFVKLIQNAYRDVNIALANEISIIARRIGLDARSALNMANKHPRVELHQPGPGVGGHCIPVDPYFLIEQAPDEARLIGTARRVNDEMPRHVVRIVEEAIDPTNDKPRIAVLGLAYKGNVSDVRESPSFRVIDLLQKRWPQATLVLSDPHVDDPRYPAVPVDEAIGGADCILVLTDHREYREISPQDAATKVRNRTVVDTRGMLDTRVWAENGFRTLTL